MSEKSLEEYKCDACEYITTRRSDYKKHCMTNKHKKLLEINKSRQINHNGIYICNMCNKQYKDRSGLWRHNLNACSLNPKNRKKEKDIEMEIEFEKDLEKQQFELIKKALNSKQYMFGGMEKDNDNLSFIGENNRSNMDIMISKQQDDDNESVISKASAQNSNLFPERELLMEFIKQNQELKHILLEEREENKNRMNQTNVVINNNNNNFNLNIFLNEKCKNALSMMDFIDSLQVGANNAEYTGVHGYVEGITKIFVDGLKQLDIYERPIHCTDLKRETLYIKEDDCWEKDNQDKEKLRKAIGAVVKKNMQQVKTWKEENPKFDIMNTREYELHLNIMQQSLGGGNQEKTDKNNEKIIKNISKYVLVDKMAVCAKK